MITDDVKKFITDNWDNVVRYNPCDKDTLIGLPFPYTVPCISDTFQELYYWDTYFTNIGLLLSDKTEIAKNNVDNMIYLINKFGFMLNGSRTYYLFRSQPPFLSLMVRDIFEKTKDKDWLFACYTALKKDYDFWNFMPKRMLKQFALQIIFLRIMLYFPIKPAARVLMHTLRALKG